MYYKLKCVVCLSTVVFRYCNNVGQAGISPCQVDHRESDRDQDGEDGQGPSDQAGAGPLPPQGNHTTQLFLILLQPDWCWTPTSSRRQHHTAVSHTLTLNAMNETLLSYI